MDTFLGLYDGVSVGIATAFTGSNLFYCFVGVFLGTLLGVLPGIGALSALSMLFPVTFYLPPASALIMLAGVYYGTAYGGSIASILLNTPGTPSSAIACLDGYPMARQGRAGVALFITAVGSFVGASIGIALLMVFAPMIVTVALRFQSPEFFSLMVLGVVAASTISDGSAIKGLAMVVLGIMLGMVGLDGYTAVPRLTFGFLPLYDGISVVVVAMALFAVAEVITVIGSQHDQVRIFSVKLRSMLPTRDDIRRSWRPILRGTGVGAFFGILPGTGGFIASFMSYVIEKKIAADPSRFGKGAIEGVAAPESANNAADQTSFIPTLTLGIPGNPTMAIMLGALMVHGIVPGPRLMTDTPEIFWGLVMSFWVGNLLLLILNIPLIGLWVRLLTIPYHLLYPAILVFVCFGVYSVRSSILDVQLVVLLGAVGYGLRVLGFSAAPLILGFVLGPMMEDHFRRAMLISRGSFTVFVERPISAGILLITVLIMAWAAWSGLRPRKAAPAQL